MKLIQDILKNYAERSERGLIANYDRLGLRASSAWAEALESEVSVKKGKYNVIFLGKSYTEQLEIGRRPNEKRTHEELVKFAAWSVNAWVNDWLKNKGLNLNAFGVAYNIEKFGIKVPNRFNDGGLVSNVFTPENLKKLNREISLFFVSEVKSDIKGLFEG